MNGEIIKMVNSHKHLGIILSDDLKFSEHIENICIRGKKRLDIMKSTKKLCLIMFEST